MADTTTYDIELSLEKRSIAIDTTEVVAVVGDDLSQSLTIKCPRYYDGVDLSTKSIYINYKTASGACDIYEVNSSTVAYDSTYIYFTWLLSKGVCAVEGTTEFAIDFRNASSSTVDYSLNTQKGAFEVKGTLTVSTDELTAEDKNFYKIVVEDANNVESAKLGMKYYGDPNIVPSSITSTYVDTYDDSTKEYTVFEFETLTSTTCKCKFKGFETGMNQTLVVPYCSPDGKIVTSIGIADTLEGDSAAGEIFYLILPNTLTEIPANSLKGFANLTDIYIPKSVRTIGDNAFSFGCNGSIIQISIPEGVTTIGANLLNGCDSYSLEFLTIPKSVTTIGDNLLGSTLHNFKCVYCYSDSVAETYCKTNGIKYKLLDYDPNELTSADIEINKVVVPLKDILSVSKTITDLPDQAGGQSVGTAASSKLGFAKAFRASAISSADGFRIYIPCSTNVTSAIDVTIFVATEAYFSRMSSAYLIKDKTVSVSAAGFVDFSLAGVTIPASGSVFIGFYSATNTSNLFTNISISSLTSAGNSFYVDNIECTRYSGGWVSGSSVNVVQAVFYTAVESLDNSNIVNNNKTYVGERGNRLRVVAVSDIHFNAYKTQYSNHSSPTNTCAVNINDSDRIPLLVDSINAENAKDPIDFVIVNGDLLSLYSTDDKVAVLKAFKSAFIDKLDMPCVCLGGNHDGLTAAQWLEILGQPKQFSIHTEDYAFICCNVYSNETVDTTNTSGLIYNGCDFAYAGCDVQKTWIQNELNKAKTANKKVIMVWHTFDSTIDTWMYSEYISNANIIGDIIGHSHLSHLSNEMGKPSVGTGTFGHLEFDSANTIKLASMYSYKILEVSNTAFSAYTVYPAVTYKYIKSDLTLSTSASDIMVQPYSVSAKFKLADISKYVAPTFDMRNISDMKYASLRSKIDELGKWKLESSDTVTTATNEYTHVMSVTSDDELLIVYTPSAPANINTSLMFSCGCNSTESFDLGSFNSSYCMVQISLLKGTRFIRVSDINKVYFADVSQLGAGTDTVISGIYYVHFYTGDVSNSIKGKIEIYRRTI